MKQLDLTIPNATGLHARPAKALVKLAKKFKSSVKIEHGSKVVNAKSMISVLTLGVKHEGLIRVLIDGEDEQDAATAIEEAVRTGLGEPLDHAPAASENGKPKPEEAKTKPAPAKPVNANVIQGIAASQGIAIGPIFKLERGDLVVDAEFESISAEKAKLQAALTSARADLKKLAKKTTETVGAEEAGIFEAHLELLEDPDILDAVQEKIACEQAAAMAWKRVVMARAEMLSKVDDPILAGRSADMRDVGERVLAVLTGQKSGADALPDVPIIIIADDLSPSDTVSLDKSRVLGFCTASGGPNAHSAILARALGLPAIVGAGDGVLELENGTAVVLDGGSGELTLRPSAEKIAQAQAQQADLEAAQEAAQAAAADAAITIDGTRIEVVANVGGVADAELAYESGAEGVGLLRTEFLFMGRDEAPSEDEQFTVYRDVVTALHLQPVIVRTLDVGGDKPLAYIDVPEEDNPFLGERGIRLCLNRPELLKEQLRAIIRAAKFGKVRIMFPMVSDVSELIRAKQMVAEVCTALSAPMVDVGIMIEVPSAALMADVLAEHVDFFSIGTNDLTQYTLAIDRMHPIMAKQADGLHPAVLRLIAKTVEGAHAAGKWVGVCGELGSDKQAVPILIGLGVDELSVSAPAVPAVKAQIRGLKLTDAEELAKRALACATSQDVRDLT